MKLQKSGVELPYFFAIKNINLLLRHAILPFALLGDIAREAQFGVTFSGIFFVKAPRNTDASSPTLYQRSPQKGTLKKCTCHSDEAERALLMREKAGLK